MVTVMPFSDTEITELPLLLSLPRFETYLIVANGNAKKALELYEWNLCLSSAFLIPLHICEILIRNSVSEAISGIYGRDWHKSAAFLRSLPDARQHYSPKNDLQRNQNLPSIGKVIAELKFIFWQQMFTARHDDVVWKSHLWAVFPNLDKEKSVQTHRSKLYADLGIIRELRNRIAHHEPIFNRNLQDDLSKIFQLVSLRSPVAADWLKRLETVDDLIGAKPK
jgi:Abi-like protein